MTTSRSISILVLGVVFGVNTFVEGFDAYIGPPCEAETNACFKDATCNTDSNMCVCNNYFVMSGDWTRCLPVVSSAHESKCEESSQCTPRLGVGSVCSEEVCTCMDGFYYLHGFCNKGVGYGKPCLKKEDCYGGYSYEILTCVDNLCQCAEGYYLVGSSDCRKAGIDPGDGCFSDLDCQYEGGFCDTNNVCRDENENFGSTLSFNDEPVLGYSKLTEVITEASSVPNPKLQLGDACKTTEECVAAVSDSMCFGDVCVCSPGYFNVQGVCKKELGESCTEEEDIDYISNAECRNNALTCKAGRMIVATNRMCRATRTVGGQCQVLEQCLYSGQNAVCNLEERQCQCLDGSHYVEYLKLCIPSVGIGGDCADSYNCYASSGNVSCVDNKCRCKEGFHKSSGSCTPDVEELSDACLGPEDCNSIIQNSTCVKNKCQCVSGYFQDPSTNNKCLRGVDGDCADDSDCSFSPLSHCESNKCTCDSGTVANTAKNKCLAVATKIQSVCEEDLQCVGTLGAEGIACIDGECACKEDYHFRNNYCWEKRLLGDRCKWNSQCYLNSNLTDRTECRNGMCQCTFYYEQSGLDCKSGGSNQSVTSKIVIGACVLIGVLLSETKYITWI